MKRWALTIAAGPTYDELPQYTGHDVVQAGAEDALGRVVEALTVLRRLVALLVAGSSLLMRYGRIDRYWAKNGSMSTTRSLMTGSPRIGSSVMSVPTFSISWPQASPFWPVDDHGVGSAHAVRARAPEGERAVVVPLRLVQRVEHAILRIDLDLVLLPVRLLVDLGVVALHLQVTSTARPSVLPFHG